MRTFLSVSGIAVAAAVAAAELPPLPAPQPVIDTHRGVQIEDTYRYLENTGDPAVQKYMRAQSDPAYAHPDFQPR